MTASNFDAALTVMLSVHNQELKELNDNCARPAKPEPIGENDMEIVSPDEIFLYEFRNNSVGEWKNRSARVVKSLDGLVQEGRNIRSGKYTFPTDATVECMNAIEKVHLLSDYEKEYNLMRNLLHDLRNCGSISSRRAVPSVNVDLLDGAWHALRRKPFPFPEVYNGIK